MRVAQSESEASAVIEQGRVFCPDPAAAALGVVPGQRLATALGLCPGLRTYDRAPAREAQALALLGYWAGGYSPLVSLAPPAALLLEVGGCLRLFGGQAQLCARLRAEAAAQGHTLVLAAAPTAQAALWLAEAGVLQGMEPAPVLTFAALPASLAKLPLAVLEPALVAPTELAALGLRTLGELDALPAAGLARRFGPALPQAVARAHGQAPDPRTPLVFPERFRRELELPAQVAQAGQLFFAARRLIAALAGWLAQRGAGLRSCRLHLLHAPGRWLRPEPTELPLQFADTTRDEARLLRVLRERLERLRLRDAVEALVLEADAIETLPGHTLALFGTLAATRPEPVLERLAARLGAHRVYRLGIHPDHRPECASRTLDWQPDAAAITAVAAAPPSLGHRPLWLLNPPRPLAEHDGRPCCEVLGEPPDRARGSSTETPAAPQGGAVCSGAALRILGRAERIESGWWDEGEAGACGELRRDYFVAYTPQGQWWWIFRDARGWWLHGIYA